MKTATLALFDLVERVVGDHNGVMAETERAQNPTGDTVGWFLVPVSMTPKEWDAQDALWDSSWELIGLVAVPEWHPDRVASLVDDAHQIARALEKATVDGRIEAISIVNLDFATEELNLGMVIRFEALMKTQGIGG